MICRNVIMYPKNVDNDFQHMKNVYKAVKQIELLKKDLKEPHLFISRDAYNAIVSHGDVDDDMIYYVIDPEFGQYVEGYVVSIEYCDEVKL